MNQQKHHNILSVNCAKHTLRHSQKHAHLVTRHVFDRKLYMQSKCKQPIHWCSPVIGISTHKHRFPNVYIWARLQSIFNVYRFFFAVFAIRSTGTVPYDVRVCSFNYILRRRENGFSMTVQVYRHTIIILFYFALHDDETYASILSLTLC